MSDPKASYGDPVEEPKDGDDDVLRRAQAGLADAEAARSGVEPTPADERAPDDARNAPASDVADHERTAQVTDAAASARAEQPVDADASVRGDEYAGSTTAAVPAAVVDNDRAPENDHALDDRSLDNDRALDNDRTLANDRVVEPEQARSGEPASTPWYEKVDDDEARWAAYAASAETTDRSQADDTPTVAATPVTATPVAVTPNEPVAPSAFGANAQPIFVQAPEAPRPRGNRGAAGAIGLLAALVFAVLYLAATLGFGLLYREFAVDEILDEALRHLTTFSLWVPVVVFYIAFWFLGALINRGRWGHWVVWGLLVGVAAWGGHILGQLFQAPFWMLTAREGADLIEAQALAPLAIVAFVLGRELTIWFGAWVARRGKRMTELNDEAQREYERTLEAGPQLHHA